MNPFPHWSRLGLGTGTLASLGRAASAAQVDALLGTMLDLGQSVIDTADTYGSGDSERMLARALRGKRDHFTVVTKAGYRHADLPGPLRVVNQFAKKGLQYLGRRQSFSPEYIARCVDRSLSRLGTDHVEAFLLHNPPAGVVENGEILQVLQGIVDSGKARQIGVSSFDPHIVRTAIETGSFGVIQTMASLRVAMAMRPLWRECAARGIGLIGNHVFDPLCLGADGLTHEKLMRASAALLPAHATILSGTRNPEHLREAWGWALNPLPEDEVVGVVSKFGSLATASATNFPS